ncbi:MAG: GTPase ObgE [Clostridia bacterium]|nr:GTPase ObgE [Clostridia bacterium]
MFIDKVKIYVKAGNGGNGCVSFRREKYVAKGGPDGGDGGHGGNVIFSIDKGTNTLLSFRYKRKFVAENGGDGKGAKFHGKNGEDIIIKVPEGTLIKDEKTGKILKDMSDCEDWICAKGGRGGWGNRHFATPTRQIPMFAKSGTKGQEWELTLELKMLADVGLVGLPSAGKSSLLAAVSDANPKIADYHFTTLSPNLGVVKIREGYGFVMADIPGLIEGASDGAGLGHAFLRHIERCRLLVQVVDISCIEGRNPIDDIVTIDSELEKFSSELKSRPRIIVANKVDSLDKEMVDIDAFEKFVKDNGWDLIYISAYTGENTEILVEKIAKMLDTLPPLTIYEAEYTEEDAMYNDQEDHYVEISKDSRGVYVVEGEWLYNLVGQVNFEDRESLMFFQRVLLKSGVIDKLREAGCQGGDTVSMYDFEFDFVV